MPRVSLVHTRCIYRQHSQRLKRTEVKAWMKGRSLLLRSFQTLARCYSLCSAPNWHGILTSLLLSFASLFALTPLVLQGADCTLLASHTPLPRTSIFAPLRLVFGLRFVDVDMHWLTLLWNNKTSSAATAMGINFLSVTNVCMTDVDGF